jgi:hypothetical protein
MTILWERPPGAAGPAAPATHVMAVGVGAYPHLEGGSGPPAAATWSLRQLTSPPRSAEAIARWFLERHRNADAPLGSVELLVSDPAGPMNYAGTAPDGGAIAAPVEPAAMPGVEAAVKRWFARAHTDERNVAVFFFCGHGVERGDAAALLTQEFGANALDPMDDAIDFDGFKLGMDRCRARRQLFVLDACRNTPATLLGMIGGLGRSIVAPNLLARVSDAPRDFPVVYATGQYQTAYGRPGQPSLFTQALLQGFEGSASDDVTGAWLVSTDRLVSAVSALLDLEARHGAPVQKAFVGGNSSGFVLHRPGLPRVPVVVCCEPPALTAQARLEIARNGAIVQSRPPAPDDWVLPLEVDLYDVAATLPAGVRHLALTVRPPYREARLA